MGVGSTWVRCAAATAVAVGSFAVWTDQVAPARAAEPTVPASARMNTFLPDTPDPEVTYAEGHFWTYGTETTNTPVPLAAKPLHIPVMRADSLGGVWSAAGDALPDPGPWVYDDDPSNPDNMRFTWAPAVQHVGTTWVMFYAAPRASSPGSTDSKQRCIGRAVASTPEGPFVDSSPNAFHCPPGELWAIDPSTYRDDDGTLYLHWREDDGAQPTGPHIRGGRLDANASSITQMSPFLVGTDAAWERWIDDHGNARGLIENPAMQKGVGPTGATYYLFYSANAWEGAGYATGYATCDTPMGPCTKHTDTARGPWLASSTTDVAKGPGGAEVFSYNGDLYLAWHAWTAPTVGYPAGGARGLRAARLTFDGAGPHLVRPMQGQRVDHAFMIDTTGSMWDDIDAVRASAGEIIGRLSESGADWRVGIVEYKDYPVSPYGSPGDFTGRVAADFTNQPDPLFFALGLMQASGGNDTPESALSAAMMALDPTQLHWRNQMGVKKSITPFTDAGYHDPEPWPGGHTAVEVIAAAWALDPAVFYPVIVGGDPSATAAFEVLASQSGGRVFAATDATGVVDAILALLTEVLQTPTAIANGPYSGVAGVPMTLDAMGSADSDGTIVDYSWDVDGDGSFDISTTAPQVQTVYAAAGDYTATLRVTDNDGLSQTALASVRVEPAGGGRVSMHVSGPAVFDADGPFAGSLSMPVDRYGLVAVTGSGNVGVQSVGFDLHRFWVLPLYAGTLQAGQRTIPLLLARVSWDAATRSAASSSIWFDLDRFPWRIGRVSWQVST